ncbi:hypothetical protein V5799_008265 [Amblyomma americanum]|uniref:Transmembrane protein n=1 Tax=Amblyomma americanum TaxID=6943 RepID=A0AAQ4FFF4_AMBAM
MFRIPKSQLSRPRDPSTPPASAASIHAEGEAGPSARQRPAGLRPPFTPFQRSAAGGTELQTSSSSRPSTAAYSKTSSSLRDDGGEDRVLGYGRRLRERHVTQEEGGGACVVVVAPGPVAAAAAAASRRQPKVGARVMLAVLVGSSLLLLSLLLAYNTEVEKTVIYKVKAVFDKALHRRQIRVNANSTNSTSIEAGGDDGGPGASAGSTTGETTLFTDLPENAAEFEKRLREMVSRFWTPRGENDYAGNGGLGFDPERTMATRRNWRHRKNRGEDEMGGPPPIPRVRNRGPEQPDLNDEPTEPLSPPYAKDAPNNRGTNWFLVQARRRQGRLPDTFFSGNDSSRRSGNASLEDAAEIEQFWQEGDAIDEDDARHRF